ncbi:helix-turn-helix domain-containing protein [Galbibacter marinus]|uniref:helix-turn-helix domain-containing protein n=1 Tax=Galbibacter marinus TaxID=555500 RepID=UPI00138AAF61|nr:AraC family transcriptional regulator [Galbibacter marinus]
MEPIKSTIDKYKRAIEKDLDSTNEAIKRLTFYMENEKPYLDYELTLQKLASQLDMPEKEISILINHHLGKHFFDFINEYRIEEAKRILGNQQNKALTILEILYQVGFNSKSSFYTAFKKVTNQTPTAYRKSALPN